MSTEQKSITITRQLLNQSNDWDATYKVEVDGKMIEGDIRPCDVYLGQDVGYVPYSAYEVSLLVAYRYRPRGADRINVTMVTDEDVAQKVTHETYTFDGRSFSLVSIS